MNSKPRVAAPVDRTGNVFRDSALGLVPETVEGIGRLSHAVWVDSGLPPSLLELLRLRNADHVGCVVCRNVRYDAARADGLDEDRIGGVRRGTADLSARERAALAFADLYLTNPGGLTPALASDLVRLFSARELAAMAIALVTFNATSRCAVAIGGMPDAMPVSEVSVEWLDMDARQA